MRLIVIVAMLVSLLTLIGCAKKNAKNTAPTRDESASAKPQTAATAAGNKDKKDDKADAPNWLTDPRFKTDPPPGQPAEGGGATGKQSWGIAPPEGGWQPPAGGPQPAPAGAAPGGAVPGAAGPGQPAAPGLPPPPGMGVLQPQPNPAPAAPATGTPAGGATKTVTMADMREVWVYIDNASGASGKMPTQLMIYQALIVAKSPAAELVKDGAIYLTGATQRESVWAYETQALTSGGLVVSQNGVETLTAAQLRARLGK
jgi:hypothetical protein